MSKCAPQGCLCGYCQENEIASLRAALAAAEKARDEFAVMVIEARELLRMVDGGPVPANLNLKQAVRHFVATHQGYPPKVKP